MIYFPVVFIPLAQEAQNGVEKEEEEKNQDEDFLGSDLYRVEWSGTASGLVGRDVGQHGEVTTAGRVTN